MGKIDCDGIIFDLDGTLWDATKVNKIAWDRAYEQLGYGVSKVEDALFRSCMGMVLTDIAGTIHPEIEKKDLHAYVERCIKIEHELLGQTGGILYPDLRDVLKSLSKKHPLCVVSNCQAGYIELFMDVHAMGEYFVDLECPGNTGRLKADNIRLVVERNHFSKPVYVGDTAGDMNSAHQAGVPFVWAAYGFGRDLTGYEYRVDSLNALKQLLE